MKIKLSELKQIIKETQWGAFTGGAAPLDEPPLDSGQMDPDQQQKVFDILVDTGSDPKQLKASGEFPDVVVEIKLKLSELRQIIHETVDDWYSDEHETLGDKKFADQIDFERSQHTTDLETQDKHEMQQMGRDLYNQWRGRGTKKWSPHEELFDPEEADWEPKGDESADDFLERSLVGMRDIGSIEDEEDYTRREKLVHQGFRDESEKHRDKKMGL